jgi:hypothetical protein
LDSGPGLDNIQAITDKFIQAWNNRDARNGLALKKSLNMKKTPEWLLYHPVELYILNILRWFYK